MNDVVKKAFLKAWIHTCTRSENCNQAHVQHSARTQVHFWLGLEGSPNYRQTQELSDEKLVVLYREALP